MTILDRARVVIEGDTVALTRALRGAEAGLAQAGAKMERLGRSLSLRVTAPLLAIGAAAFKVGADFEESLSKIVGLVGVAQEQVDAWGREILDLAPQLGKAPKELADALFFVTSAGFRGAEAMDVLVASARASAAGLGDTATVADAVTSAVNAYGQENLSAAFATDILTAAVREGKLEAASITPVLGNLLPTASALGIGFEQVAGSLAVFSRTGTDAASGATSLQAIMLTLLKPTSQAQKALEGAGLSMADLRKVAAGPGGLIEVMRLLEETFSGNDEALARIFPNVRAFRGVMNALAQDAGTVDDVMRGVADAAGSADKAFAAAEETARFKLNAALAKLSASFVKLSDSVIPAVIVIAERFASVVSTLAAAFSGMHPRVRQTIVVVAALVAAIGPLLLALGSLTLVISSLKLTTLTAGMVSSTAAVLRLVPAVNSLSAALALLKIAIGPTGWLILGLGAVVGLVTLWARRQRELRDELDASAARVDGYRAALVGWTQAAREAELVRLDEALGRHRSTLQSMKDELTDLTEIIDGVGAREIDPLVRADSITRRQELRKELETQRAVVQRLEEDHGLVAEAVRDGSVALAELDELLKGLGAGGGDGVASVVKILETLSDELRQADALADLLGDQFDLTSARAEAYGVAVRALVAEDTALDVSLDATGKTVRGLAVQFLELEDAALLAAEAEARLRQQQEAVTSATERFTVALRDNATLSRLLGDEFDATGASIRAYEQLVHSLVAAGVDFDAVIGPQGETLRELADTYLDLAAGATVAAEREREVAAIIESTLTPLERYEATLARLNELRVDLGDETFARAVQAAGDELDRATGKAGSLESSMVSLTTSGVDAFTDAVTGAGQGFSRFIQRAVADIARLIGRLLVARALMAAFPGGGFIGALAGALIPGRAHGGPVRKGEPYFTGERGPELFIPDVSGFVVSAAQTNRLVARAGVQGSAVGAGAAGQGLGALVVRLDESSLPPRATVLTPEGIAQDDWWRRAFGNLKLDLDDRGGL